MDITCQKAEMIIKESKGIWEYFLINKEKETDGFLLSEHVDVCLKCEQKRIEEKNNAAK